jgi:hypothetical protein
MLLQQPNGEAAWVRNGSRNVEEEEEAAEPEPDSEEEEPVSFSSPATTPKWQYCVSPAFWVL